jgi:lipopolysaccharide/colanic/teichoic acid biosynthesis glycosyltransferase
MRAFGVLSIDLVLVAIATALALSLRDNFEISWPHVVALVPYAGLSLLAAAVTFPLFGVSRVVWQFTSMRDYLTIVLATAVTVVAALALGFVINRLEGIARALPVLQALLIIAQLVGLRVGVRMAYLATRRRAPARTGQSARGETVLVVGVNKLTELYLHCVAEFAGDRVRIAGLLDNEHPVGATILTHRVLAPPEQVAEALRTLEIHGVSVDRIIIATPFDRLSAPAQQALHRVAESTTIRLEQLDRRMGLGPSQAAGCDDPGDGVQIFSFDADTVAALARSPYWRLKRTLDIFGALALLVMFAPVMVWIGVLVAFDVGLPVMFWQQRPGLGGRPFRLYKFRTMKAAYDNAGRRRSDDERVSAIGTLLRRTRLDELPQLVSILRGQMSFVGPRPLLPVDQPAAYAARLLVRPGLTGWAQVKGGRTIAAADKAALDVWYVRNMSLALDLKIALATVPMVLFGERVIDAAIAAAWHDLCAAGICVPAAVALRID